MGSPPKSRSRLRPTSLTRTMGGGYGSIGIEDDGAQVGGIYEAISQGVDAGPYVFVCLGEGRGGEEEVGAIRLREDDDAVGNDKVCAGKCAAKRRRRAPSRVDGYSASYFMLQCIRSTFGTHAQDDISCTDRVYQLRCCARRRCIMSGTSTYPLARSWQPRFAQAFAPREGCSRVHQRCKRIGVSHFFLAGKIQTRNSWQ